MNKRAILKIPFEFIAGMFDLPEDVQAVGLQIDQMDETLHVRIEGDSLPNNCRSTPGQRLPIVNAQYERAPATDGRSHRNFKEFVG